MCFQKVNTEMRNNIVKKKHSFSENLPFRNCLTGIRINLLSKLGRQHKLSTCDQESSLTFSVNPINFPQINVLLSEMDLELGRSHFPKLHVAIAHSTGLNETACQPSHLDLHSVNDNCQSAVLKNQLRK